MIDRTNTQVAIMNLIAPFGIHEWAEATQFFPGRRVDLARPYRTVISLRESSVMTRPHYADGQWICLLDANGLQSSVLAAGVKPAGSSDSNPTTKHRRHSVMGGYRWM